MNKESSQHFVREFLFSASDIRQEDRSVKAMLVMDEKKEGWMGIPHGGIGMGAVMELVRGLKKYPSGGALYPLSAEFRMGGSSVRVGDVLDIVVSAEDGGAQGEITKSGEDFSYISASIAYGKDEPQRRNLIASYLPDTFFDLKEHLIELPYYKNCFVCGVHRNHPGLKRRFYLVNGERSEKNVVFSTAGFDSDDKATFDLFQEEGAVHPIAPLAVLDETLGWSGFLTSKSGAVTVLIGYTFYRPIYAGEKLVFFGRTERVRGRPRARVMFWASGGVAAVDAAGRFDIVMTAQGQWMGVPELTDQMHRELIPKGMVERALEAAAAGTTGGPSTAATVGPHAPPSRGGNDRE
ncbi:MAG: hypothetical protein JW943_16310 [Deltaproteobacteria bacterium]|nr:hypothetical protein [Deltaproteobacteria bacterium]